MPIRFRKPIPAEIFQSSALEQGEAVIGIAPYYLSAVRVRHYEFENPEDGTILHVHPPKLEAVEIFNKVFTDKESTPKDMAGVTAALLSDNEEGVRITSKKLMGWANIDQLSALIEDFLGWMNNTKASNPN